MKIFIGNRWQFRYEPSLVGNYFLYDILTPSEYVINRSIINLLCSIENDGNLDIVCKELNIKEDKLITIINRLNSVFPELITTEGKDRNHSSINLTVEYHQFHLDFPKSVEIQITDKCNLCCKHCIASSGPKLGANCIEAKYWCRLLDELEYMRTYKVTITGGEMLTYNGIDQILEKASQSAIHFYFLTNAILVNEHRAKLLSRHNMTVAVSIDGITDKTHDFLRGKGSYKKLQNGLDLLLKHQAKVELSVTVHSHNYKELEELIIFGIDKGCKGITFVLLDNSGRASENNSLHLSIDLTRLIMEKLETLKIKYSKKITVSYINPSTGLSNVAKEHCLEGKVYCTGAVSHVAISSNGDVYPCAFAFGNNRFNAGNIKALPLSKIWNNQKWSIMRGELLYKDLRVCSSCEYNDKCALINCRVRALNFSGDILGIPACTKAREV